MRKTAIMMSSESELTQNKMWANLPSLAVVLAMLSLHCLFLLASASVTHLHQHFNGNEGHWRGI